MYKKFLSKIKGFDFVKFPVLEFNFDFKSNILKDQEYYLLLGKSNDYFSLIFENEGFYYESIIEFSNDKVDFNIKNFHFIKFKEWDSPEFLNYPTCKDDDIFNMHYNATLELIDQIINHPDYRLKLLYKKSFKEIVKIYNEKNNLS